jgi:ParB family transcriptional regulator, chromosome partitioning protein
VRSGKLSAGNARLLVGVPRKSPMSMRQLEAELRADRERRAIKVPGKAAGRAKVPKDADTRALERRTSDALGLEVTIDHRGDGGTLQIKYKDLDQLDAVVRKLGG